MRKNHAWIMATMLVLASGCSDDSLAPTPAESSVSSARHPFPIKERYEVVRDRLIADGWKPVAAKCSSQNMCGEHMELSTDMSTAISCGVFTKDNQIAKVCGESIPDALLVTSVKIEPLSE